MITGLRKGLPHTIGARPDPCAPTLLMPTGFSRRLATVLADLPPAAFAVVMASGIVADAMDRVHLPDIARILLWFSAGAFAILAVLFVARLAAFPLRIIDDLRHAVRAPDFLTITAGSCVLGGEFIILQGSPTTGAVLWLVGIGAWVVLIYTIIAVLAVLPQKQGLGEEFDGNWLLMVVAVQAIAVLGAILAYHSPAARGLVLAVALMAFLFGSLLYVVLLALLLNRLLFFPLEPASVTPPYWIGMGAAAISTFAGSLLVRDAPLWPLLGLLLPLLTGLAILFWTTATWWIPLLLILGGWRHILQRVPIRYNTQYWAIVFPLGMYAVASLYLHDDIGWPILQILGQIFAYAALAAWALAAVGLVRALFRSFRI